MCCVSDRISESIWWMTAGGDEGQGRRHAARSPQRTRCALSRQERHAGACHHDGTRDDRNHWRDLPPVLKEEPVSDDLYAQMKQTVIDGEAEEAAALARKGLDAGLPPGDILDKGFVKGIEEVGDLFGRGEFFLPCLLYTSD